MSDKYLNKHTDPQIVCKNKKIKIKINGLATFQTNKSLGKRVIHWHEYNLCSAQISLAEISGIKVSAGRSCSVIHHTGNQTSTPPKHHLHLHIIQIYYNQQQHLLSKQQASLVTRGNFLNMVLKRICKLLKCNISSTDKCYGNAPNLWIYKFVQLVRFHLINLMSFSQFIQLKMQVRAKRYNSIYSRRKLLMLNVQHHYSPYKKVPKYIIQQPSSNCLAITVEEDMKDSSILFVTFTRNMCNKIQCAKVIKVALKPQCEK